MKAMEFLTLLGELDETAAAPVTIKKKHRPLWVAAAACLCVCLLGFSAWFFVPPMGVHNQAQQFTVLRVGDRLATYYVVDTQRMSRFERSLLPDTPGEELYTHGGTTFFRVRGADDLVYLLGETEEGYTLYEFEHFISLAGVDMRTSYWYESGWLTDEDIAALDGITKPTMGEVFETVYGVTSADGLKSVRFEKNSAYGGGVESKVRVKAVTVKDGEALGRLYALLAPMIQADYGQAPDFGSVGVHDEAYLSGAKPLSAQVNRDLTVTLDSGRRVTLSYYPATGLLRQRGTELYTVLSDADNAWLIDLADIDMDWKDWGTEKAPVYGEGCETATVPEATVTEKPAYE